MARGTTVFIPTKSSLDRWLLIGAQPRSCLSSIEHVPLCSGGTWRAKVTEECWDLELLSIPAWGLSNGLGLLRWHVSGREPKDWKGQRTGWGDWLIVIDSDFKRAHMSNFISFQRWTKIGLEAGFYQSKNSQSQLCQFGCTHTQALWWIPVNFGWFWENRADLLVLRRSAAYNLAYLFKVKVKR